MEHPHDGTAVQIKEQKQWPSVARCTAGQVSTDSFPCDHNNNMEHPHDGTAVQIAARPPIKCIDPVHGNPITCDWDDIDKTNRDPLPKDALGFTPQKIIEGGPNIVGPVEMAAQAEAEAKAKAAKEAAAAGAKKK